MSHNQPIQVGSVAQHFDTKLARKLATKIVSVYPEFKTEAFCASISKLIAGQTYSQRLETFADQLHNFLPPEYPKAIQILKQIMGQENQQQTGMFKNFYWLLPISKFIEMFGLDYFDESIEIIAELTKRSTGEYAIRPFIEAYPEKSLKHFKKWAVSDNFHLRRLASEGLRPKLPWAKKLSIFIENPTPVFDILNILQEDSVLFVKKSVANHITDYLKLNPKPTKELLKNWQKSENLNTQWIIKRAIRKFPTIQEELNLLPRK